MSKFTVALLATASVVSSAETARALDPGRPVTHYVQRHFGVAQGLPHAAVYDIAQTPDGFVWAATEEGLARLDGAELAVFDTARGLPAQWFTRIYVEGADLWLSSFAHGLFRLRAGLFEAAFPEAGNTVKGVLRDHRGTLWIATWDRGVFYCRSDELRGAVRFEAVPVTDIRVLFEDRRGRLWIGTAGGLYCLEEGRLRTYGPQEGLAEGRVNVVFEDDGGKIWLGTHAGLLQLTNDRFTPAVFSGTSVTAPVGSMLQDRHGSLWVAAKGQGVLRLRDGKGEWLTEAAGSPLSRAWLLFEDREGVLWIGTDDNGLTALVDSPFVSTRDDLDPAVVRSVLETPDGDVWASTSTHLARQHDGHWLRITTADGLPANETGGLYRDRLGRLWVGTTKGLAYECGERFCPFETLSPSEDPFVQAMLEVGDGTLWVGDFDGLWSFTESKLARHIGRPDVGGGGGALSVDSLALDRAGRLYAGTLADGLLRIDGSALRRFTVADGLPSDVVNGLFVDADDNVWAATDSGIALVRGDSVVSFTRRNGLTDNNVFAIAADEQDRLWMCSNRAVFHANRKALLDAATNAGPATVQFVAYDSRDGAAADGCFGQIQPAIWRSEDGGLFFANDAIGSVRPEALPPPAVVQPLITEVRVDETAVDLRTSVSLAAGARILDIGFAAPTFVRPQAVAFEYMLEGFDPQWRNAGRQRSLRFTRLPAGEYRLRLRARQDDGPVRELAEPFVIRQLPYWHETWLVRAAAAVAAFGLLAAAYVVRVRRLAARKRVLELAVTARTHELSEQKIVLEERTTALDRALGDLKAAQLMLVQSEKLASVAALVSGIAHELNNPLAFIFSNIPPLQRYCQSLCKTVARLSDSVPESQRDELTAMPGGKSLAAVEHDLTSLIQDMAEGARRSRLIIRDLQNLTAAGQRAVEQVDLRRAVEQSLTLLGTRLEGIAVERHLEETPKVAGLAGQLEQAIMNLLDNAARAAAPTGRIQVELAHDHGCARLTVRDTGPGVPPELLSRLGEPFLTTRRPGEGSGLGLAIVKAILSRHKGTLALRNGLAGGFEAEAVIPLSGALGDGSGRG